MSSPGMIKLSIGLENSKEEAGRILLLITFQEKVIHFDKWKEFYKNNMTGIIYRARNMINHKYYVGQTIFSLDERKRKHEFNAKKKKVMYPFYSAIRKYGFNNFDWEIVETLENDIKEDLLYILHVAEIYRVTWKN